MSDPLARILVVAAIIAAALVIAHLANRLRKPLHPAVVVGDLGDRPGVVLFTSTDCRTCKEAIASLKDAGLRYREVTYDLEPSRFDEWRVVAVPLTVFIDAESDPVAVLTGVPTRRALSRARAKAGL
ncbi:MAG: hypothetical protein R2823_10075 [Acidimicrobiia bacterium]